eukprot:Nk52_evm6s914 gene=Nk52_evmTU6s914
MGKGKNEKKNQQSSEALNSKRDSKEQKASVADSVTYEIDSDDSEPLIRVYFWRYLVLGSFCSLTCSNALMWITFAPKTDDFQEYYGLDESQVNFMSLVFMYTFIPGCFLGQFIVDRIGLQYSVYLSAVLNCAGAWVRYIGQDPDGWNIVIAGQVIISIAQWFTLSAPSRISSEWFPAGERGIATSIGVLANNSGTAIGMIIGPYLVSTKEDIPQFLMIEAFIVTGVLIFIVSCFRGSPPLPPSMAMHMKQNVEPSCFGGSSENTDAVTTGPLQFFRDFRKLIMNMNVVFLAIGYGAIIGAFYAVATLISAILGDIVDDVTVGWIGFTLTTSGIIGSIVCGYILDSTGKFKLINVLLFGLTLVFYAVWMIVVEYLHETYLMFIVAFVLGFFMTGIMPCSFEYGAEMSYPLDENLSACLLNFSTQVVGIAMILGLENCGPFTINIATLAIIGTGFVFMVLTKERLHRQNLELEGERSDGDSETHNFDDYNLADGKKNKGSAATTTQTNLLVQHIDGKYREVEINREEKKRMLTL